MAFLSSKRQRQDFVKRFKGFRLDEQAKITRYLCKTDNINLLCDVYGSLVKTMPYGDKKGILEVILCKRRKQDGKRLDEVKLAVLGQALRNSDAETRLLRLASLPRALYRKVRPVVNLIV